MTDTSRPHRADLNRSPDEWLAIMSDPLLAQSAVDRLTSTAHELVVEGQSYRRRQKPSVDIGRRTPDHAPCAKTGGPYPLANQWSHHRGK